MEEKYRWMTVPKGVSAYFWADGRGDADGPDWWHELRSDGTIRLMKNGRQFLSVRDGSTQFDVSETDWIIRDADGRLSKCDAQTFAMEYERP